MREDKRPSPKELLEQLQAEEERIQKKEFGRLKIFLGFAAGTGKTYAMLEAAQDLKRQGVDVVAGYVEPHRRAETAAMEQGLEKLPFLMVDYKGIKVREFDLDGALKRRPKVLLVDELAHTNAPDAATGNGIRMSRSFWSMASMYIPRSISSIWKALTILWEVSPGSR